MTTSAPGEDQLDRQPIRPLRSRLLTSLGVVRERQAGTLVSGIS
ncbi:MAG TPA: hypothetical protein VJ935_09645 [Acidimicrobiia bacterium]|nr:hypothetical protein [Acidimicrobiia bacterium]